jgi:hypothetical protein
MGISGIVQFKIFPERLEKQKVTLKTKHINSQQLRSDFLINIHFPAETLFA